MAKSLATCRGRMILDLQLGSLAFYTKNQQGVVLFSDIYHALLLIQHWQVYLTYVCVYFNDFGVFDDHLDFMMIKIIYF